MDQTLRYDVAVIGSGFGGSPIALRAAAAGMRVVVLERGPRVTPEWRRELARGRQPFISRRGRKGIVQIHAMRRLLALTASALGGGSQIYTAATLRPPDDAFDDRWPESVRPSKLAWAYEQVAQRIRPTEPPSEMSRVRALKTIADRLGAVVTRLPVAIDWPRDSQVIDCIPTSSRGFRRELAAWLAGGIATRKRTLDSTYLDEATRLGADVRPLYAVEVIEPAAGGYRLHGRAPRQGVIWAKRVVLSAGTLNTIRLLLAGRDRYLTLPRLSPALGRRFHTNGDCGAALVGPRLALNVDGGPPTTGWLDYWKTDRLYLMETGVVPAHSPLFRSLLRMALRRGARRHLKGDRASPGRSPIIWTFGAMGAEETPGTISLVNGRLRHQTEAPPDAEYRRRLHVRFHELADACEATLIPGSARLHRLQVAVTVHPMGGAAIAETAARGVVAPSGEVFGHPGLFVSDASLFPGPLGSPPSMTIAALAEHIADGLARSR